MCERARGSIRVIDDEGERLGAGRDAGDFESGRSILSLAGEAARDEPAVGEVRTGEAEAPGGGLGERSERQQEKDRDSEEAHGSEGHRSEVEGVCLEWQREELGARRKSEQR